MKYEDYKELKVLAEGLELYLEKHNNSFKEDVYDTVAIHLAAKKCGANFLLKYRSAYATDLHGVAEKFQPIFTYVLAKYYRSDEGSENRAWYEWLDYKVRVALKGFKKKHPVKGKVFEMWYNITK